MPPTCKRCGLRLRRDGACDKKTCKHFKLKLKDKRGIWLKLQAEEKKHGTPIPRQDRHGEMTPKLAKQLMPRRRIGKKSAAVDQCKIENSVGCNTEPWQPTTHQTGIAIQETDSFARDILSDELLAAGPLDVVTSTQKRFFHASVVPNKHGVNNSSALLLSTAISLHFEKLSTIVGEIKSLRILAQLSAILNYAPAAGMLLAGPRLDAYVAACFLVAFELVSCWEDRQLTVVRNFVKTNISKDCEKVNICILQVLNWMGQR
jgi:hypothetical protein